MEQVFSAYPEILFIDATYKLLEIRFPVYLLLVEDGNGQSEVVAVFLLLEENRSSISSMLTFFKKYNPQWESVRVVMSDKDMTERDVISNELPQAKLLICLFHTFRSFRREVTVNKMGITPGQRDLCLQLMQEMAYAYDENKYLDSYKHFCECAPASVREYFNHHWHPIRDQWTMGMKFATGNFLNSTNNRLECINSKLKSVITTHSSVEDFIDSFFLILRVMRSERNHKAALIHQKVPVYIHSTQDANTIDYMKFLTPYAYKFVKKQLDVKDKIKLQSVDDSTDNFHVVNEKNAINVSLGGCTCYFRQSLRLPCRHIFAVRSLVGLPLFDESLCDKRWSSAYYKDNQRVFLAPTSSACTSIVDIHRVVQHKKRVLSQVTLNSYFNCTFDIFMSRWKNFEKYLRLQQS